jgi:hypothetical protein
VLSVDGLGDSDARALLVAGVHAPLDAAVCEQIIAESHGNPLALLELPRTWNVAELAGGFGFPASHAVVGKIEQNYERRLQLLPAETQLLVLAAAAQPLGDPVLLHRAAGTLGLDMSAAAPAVDEGLLEVTAHIKFAHHLSAPPPTAQLRARPRPLATRHPPKARCAGSICSSTGWQSG